MKDGRSTRLLDAYVTAREVTADLGFGWELDWQLALTFDSIEEAGFLREMAWVILASGMKEVIVSQRFGRISAVFYNWQSAGRIVGSSEKCRSAALRIFGHKGKINAILDNSLRVAQMSFDQVRRNIELEGADFLESFDFIGPVTKYHLAKNLGLDVVKPDRHLHRIANAAGFAAARDFCEFLARLTGDRIGVVDIVVWRFATLAEQNWRLFALEERI